MEHYKSTGSLPGASSLRMVGGKRGILQGGKQLGALQKYWIITRGIQLEDGGGKERDIARRKATWSNTGKEQT